MSKPKATTPAQDVTIRHRKACRRHAGGRCNCQPSYQASLWDNAQKKRIRKNFPTLAAARLWRQDAQVALRRGTLAEAKPKLTLSEAWAADAKAGVIRTRAGEVCKPGAIRSYQQSLRLRVLDSLGQENFHSIRRVDIQNLVDKLVSDGHSASTVVGAVTALRVVFRRALHRDEISLLPTTGLQLPAVRSKRENLASPEDALKLVESVPAADRAIWATAFFAGLRRGELMALRWDCIDLKAGRIEVRASWDPIYGLQETKSREHRRVPIPSVLREHLAAQRLRQPHDVTLAFGVSSYQPFHPQALSERADAAWGKSRLTRVTLHEARHSYASFAIHAGVNALALSKYMGHASIKTTYDKYGHLFPGNEAEAATLLDDYLIPAATPA